MRPANRQHAREYTVGISHPLRIAESEEGTGPGQGGDKYDLIVENAFLAAQQNPLSTFSIDVDTASYSKTRMFLLDHQRLPPADAVRIEELVNYFTYDYAGPEDEHPFAANVEIAQCPWKPEHRLVRVGIKGKESSETAAVEQPRVPGGRFRFDERTQ